jgi:hypothetical protein
MKLFSLLLKMFDLTSIVTPIYYFMKPSVYSAHLLISEMAIHSGTSGTSKPIMPEPLVSCVVVVVVVVLVVEGQGAEVVVVALDPSSST